METVTASTTLRWLTRVHSDSRLAATARLVAAVYQRRANKTGKCWPSKRSVAQDLGLSVKTVQRANAALLKNGYVRVIRRIGGANVYELALLSSDYGTSSPIASGDLPSNPQAVIDQPVGHSRPHRGGTGVPQTYPESITGTYAASPAQRGPAQSVQTSTPAGSEETVRTAKFVPYLRRKDRGRIEVELARRIGSGGFEVLAALPASRLEYLLRRTAEGLLSERDIIEARSLANARRARNERVSPLQRGDSDV